MGIPISVIIGLVVSTLLAIAALIFMIIMIVNKSSCESTENASCTVFTCPDPNSQGKVATPAIRS